MLWCGGAARSRKLQARVRKRRCWAEANAVGHDGKRSLLYFHTFSLTHIRASQGKDSNDRDNPQNYVLFHILRKLTPATINTDCGTVLLWYICKALSLGTTFGQSGTEGDLEGFSSLQTFRPLLLGNSKKRKQSPKRCALSSTGQDLLSMCLRHGAKRVKHMPFPYDLVVCGVCMSGWGATERIKSNSDLLNRWHAREDAVPTDRRLFTSETSLNPNVDSE